MARDPEETADSSSFSSPALVQAELDSWVRCSQGCAEASAGSIHTIIPLLWTQEQSRYELPYFNDQEENMS